MAVAPRRVQLAWASRKSSDVGPGCFGGFGTGERADMAAGDKRASAAGYVAIHGHRNLRVPKVIRADTSRQALIGQSRLRLSCRRCAS